MGLAPLEAVLESVEEGLVICDTAGNALRMNRRALDIHEYASVGQAWRSLLEFEDTFALYDPEGNPISPADGPLRRAVRGEMFSELKVRIHNKRTGKEWSGRYSGMSVRDEQGNVVLTVLTLREFKEQTEKAAKEKELAQLARIPQENPDPVLRVSAEHVLLYSNPAAEELCRSWGCHKERKVPATVRKIVSAALANGAVAQHEVAFDSRTYWLTVAPSVADGYVNIYARDITDHKQAAEAMREAEQRFRTIYDNTSDGIFLLDLEARRFAMCNQSCLQMLGYTQEEFLKLDIPDLHPEADVPFIYAQIEQFIKGEKGIRHDIRFRRKDGSIVFTDLSPNPVLLDGRKYVLVALKDITERKRMEEELRRHAEHLEELVEARTGELQESERRYRSLAENAPDIIQRFDRDLRHLYVNPAFELATGLSPDAVIGKTDRELGLPADIIPFWEEAAHTVFRTGESQIIGFEMPTPRGRRHYEAHLVPEFARDGSVEHILAITRDITERKRAEDALRASEEKFRTMADQAPIMIGVTDEKGEITFLNRAWLDFRGKTLEEEPGWTWIDELHPQDRDRVVTAVRSAIERGDRYAIEYRIRDRRGDYRWVVDTASPLVGPGGEPRGYVGTALDITEQKQAQAALLESEERYRILLEYGFDGIFVHEDYRIVQLNDRLAQMVGCSPSELMGKKLIDMWTPDSQERIRQYVRSGAGGYFEKELRRRDGRILQVESYGAPCKFQGRNARIVGLRDITERKQSQEALRRMNEQLELQVAQRTEDLRHTVGRLRQLTLEISQAEDRERRRIADLLHDDVQQTLAAARFHLNLLGTEARSPEESQEIVAQVRQMLKEAIEKSRSLSHELSPVLYQVDLTEVLNWLARHMQRRHGLVVHVEACGPVDSSSEPLKAFLYRVAQELLFNVVKHAEVSEARIRVRRMGRCICLSVVDRGRGFDPQRLEGTAGFGLLTIRERVQLLGGRMKIKSVQGAGSRLLIAVPDEGLSQAAAPIEREDR